MKCLYIIIGLFLVAVFNGNAQIYNDETNCDKDTVNTAPMIEVKPALFHVSEDESGFITRQVKVLNRGCSPLRIISVTGSCGCSKASVQTGLIHPLSVGKIILYINLEGLYDDNRTIEYVIESNAMNSPTNIKVIVDEEVTKKDKEESK